MKPFVNRLLRYEIKDLAEEGILYYLLESTVRGCDTVEIAEGKVCLGMYVRQTKGFLPMFVADGALLSSKNELTFDLDRVERI